MKLKEQRDFQRNAAAAHAVKKTHFQKNKHKKEIKQEVWKDSGTHDDAEQVRHIAGLTQGSSTSLNIFQVRTAVTA